MKLDSALLDETRDAKPNAVAKAGSGWSSGIAAFSEMGEFQISASPILKQMWEDAVAELTTVGLR